MRRSNLAQLYPGCCLFLALTLAGAPASAQEPTYLHEVVPEVSIFPVPEVLETPIAILEPDGCQSPLPDTPVADAEGVYLAIPMTDGGIDPQIDPPPGADPAPNCSFRRTYVLEQLVIASTWICAPEDPPVVLETYLRHVSDNSSFLLDESQGFLSWCYPITVAAWVDVVCSNDCSCAECITCRWEGYGQQGFVPPPPRPFDLETWDACNLHNECTVP